MREQMNAILADHTGQSIETIARDTDRDRWMTPDEAVEYGLIDKVQHPRTIAAKAVAS